MKALAGTIAKPTASVENRKKPQVTLHSSVCFMNEQKLFRLCTSCWKYFRESFSLRLWPFRSFGIQKNKILHKKFNVGDCNGVGMLLFPQKLFSAASSMAQWFFSSDPFQTYFVDQSSFFICSFVYYFLTSRFLFICKNEFKLNFERLLDNNNLCHEKLKGKQKFSGAFVHEESSSYR